MIQTDPAVRAHADKMKYGRLARPDGLNSGIFIWNNSLTMSICRTRYKVGRENVPR